MIDWYVVLSIGFVLLLWIVRGLGEHSTLQEYRSYPDVLGMSKGINLLLVSLTNGSVLMLSFFLPFYYGVAGGFVLAGGGLLSLFLFSRVVRVLQPEKERDKKALVPFLKQRLTPLAFQSMWMLLLLFQLVTLLLYIKLAILFFQQMVKVDVGWAVWILLGFSLIYAGLGGLGSLRKIGSMQLFFIFLAAVIVPLSSYLFEGMQENYSSLPEEMLTIQLMSLAPLFIVCTMVLLGYLLSDPFIWEITVSIKPNFATVALRITAFCWSAIPLAFSALALYLMATAGLDSWQAFLNQNWRPISRLGLFLLSLALLAGLSAGMGQSIHSFVSIYMLSQNTFRAKKGYAAGVFAAATASIAAPFVPIEAAIGFFTLACSSFLFLMLLLVYQKGRYGILFPLFFVLSFALGWAGHIKAGWIQGIYASALLSLVGALVLAIWQYIKNDSKKV